MPVSRSLRTLADLAALVSGQVVGDPGTPIAGVADPRQAGPQDLVFLLDPKYAEAIGQSAAAAVVVGVEAPIPKPQIVVAKPRVAMARLMAAFAPPAPFTGIHPSAVIDPTATVHPEAAIGPLAYVGTNARVGAGTIVHPGVAIGRNVTVGAGCILYPRVVLYDDVQLGDRVILHAGTVVGSDGYGFVPDEAGHQLKIPQMGNVIIGDDVETGANVAIDRGTFGSTVIGRGTKLDNLVHIGHNDRIGEDCLIVSQVGISGSVTVGDRVTLAGQVGVAGHLSIGSDSMVLARTGVTKDLPPKSFVSGFPARPHKEEMRRQAALASIDRMRRDLAELKRRLDARREEPPR
ncbi:UDP-3-O-acylglucosamine N-acyltransferase [compost metagenome]